MITHTPSGRTTTYGKVAEAAAKLEPPKDIQLKDPKDWTIAGKPVKRLDTAEKLDGAQVYSIDVKLPGNAQRGHQGLPGLRRQAEELRCRDRSKACPASRRSLPVGDNGVAVVADTWWRAKTALEALPIEWDEGPNASVSSETIAEMLKEGLDAEQAFVGQPGRQRQGGARGRGQDGRGDLRLPLPAPRHHGADERDGAAGPASAARSGRRRRTPRLRSPPRRPPSGLPIDKCDVYRLNLGGGFGRRATSHDFVRQAVADRQADARHAREDDLVARGGHAARASTTRSPSARWSERSTPRAT